MDLYVCFWLCVVQFVHATGLGPGLVMAHETSGGGPERVILIGVFGRPEVNGGGEAGTSVGMGELVQEQAGRGGRFGLVARGGGYRPVHGTTGIHLFGADTGVVGLSSLRGASQFSQDSVGVGGETVSGLTQADSQGRDNL